MPCLVAILYSVRHRERLLSMAACRLTKMLRPFELARVQVVKIKELRVLLVVSCAGIFEVFVELLVPLELIAVSL